MKYAIYYFIFCYSLIVVTSCKKNNDAVPTNHTPSFWELMVNNNIKVDGSINITNSNGGNVDIDGYFNKSQAQEFKVADINIPNTTNSSYYLHLDRNDTANYTAQVARLFGNDVKVALKNNTFGDINTIFYSPSILQLSFEKLENNGLTLSKSKGVNIKWKPEERATLRNGATNKLGVLVMYSAGLYDNLDQAGLPRENVTVFKFVDDNTGEVSFTAEELSQLPLNGYGSIYVARTNQQIVASSLGRSLAITSLSLSYSPTLRFQN